MSYQSYKNNEMPSSNENWMWLLHGTGFDEFGYQNAPTMRKMPHFGADEILVRHDAVGLCGADVKLIRLGQQHPRVVQNLADDPVAVGHEVTLTIMGVGKNLDQRFKIGDRFIVQPDIYSGGKAYGYGFVLQGGLSQYSVLDKRVLDGDAGCYLLPIRPDTGYAETAIIEALAAVIAAYRLNFRSMIKPSGCAWIVGTPSAEHENYTISRGFDENEHPARLYLSCVPVPFEKWLRNRAAQIGVEVIDINDMNIPDKTFVDDLIILGSDADIIEKLTPYLGFNGVLTIMASRPVARKVKLDMGRVHYDRWVFSGTTSSDIAEAYFKPPVRSNLKANGRAWFVGSGGPIGRTHVQRALQPANGPKTILCTDLSAKRICIMEQSYAREAKEKGVEFVCITRDSVNYESEFSALASKKFDDIIVCAPSSDAIAEAFPHLAPGGVINIFAGVAKNTFVEFDISSVFLRGVRVIGFSGSTVEDMQITLKLIEAGEFAPNRLVMAIGSMQAAKEGLIAVQNSIYPGKIVIYNHIKPFPLTPISEIKDILPSVSARLKDGREWTCEAEDEFLRLMVA